MKVYHVNECFYSIQGEGARAGSANIFLRFAGCNLRCVNAEDLLRPMKGKEVDAGFRCDTEHEGLSDQSLTLDGILHLLDSKGPRRNVVLTGGEPLLQVDAELCDALTRRGYFIALETNGTIPVEDDIADWIDWLVCSPKRGTSIALNWAHEVRCTVGPEQEPDARGIDAEVYCVSPATSPLQQGFRTAAGRWAVNWCLKNPTWRLSLQLHKILGIQ
jgi:organic radical activating enzyme